MQYCYLIKDDVIIDTFESLNDFMYECDYHRCTDGVYRDSNKPFLKGRWAGCVIKITKEIL